MTGIAVIIVCGINIVIYVMTGKFPLLGSIFDKFIYYSSQISWQSDYLLFVLTLTGSWVVSVILIVLIAIGAIAQKQFDKKVLYMLCIVLFTAIFMALFSAGRYTFRDRYIMMIIPFSIGVYAYVYIILKKCNRTIANLVGVGLSVFSGWNIVANAYNYYYTENPNDIDFKTAYQTVYSYYNEDEEIPILQQMMRKWYGDMVFEHMVQGSLERENSMDSWIGFAEEYPDGIVTCEEMKIQFLTEDAQNIILNWTDRLAGQSIDNTNVNVSHYLFVNATDEYEEQCIFDMSDGIAETYDGDTLCIAVNPEEVERYFEMDEAPEIIFMQLVIDEQEVRYVQLIVPENYDQTVFYNIAWDDLRGVESAPENIYVNRFQIAAWNQALYIKNDNG